MMHIACIACTSDGVICKETPKGWTDVRTKPEGTDEDAYWTHVGYCPRATCQEAAADEHKRERSLFT